MCFVAPLATLRLVWERQSAESVPLLLTIMNFVSSLAWFFYGKKMPVQNKQTCPFAASFAFFCASFLFYLRKLACLSPPSVSSSALYFHRNSLYHDVRSVRSSFLFLSKVSLSASSSDIPPYSLTGILIDLKLVYETLRY